MLTFLLQDFQHFAPSRTKMIIKEQKCIVRISSYNLTIIGVSVEHCPNIVKVFCLVQVMATI